MQFITDKNKESFFKYLPIAKKVFPDFDWQPFQSEYERLNYSLTEIENSYNDKIKEGTLTEKKSLEFAEIFTNAKDRDSTISESIVAEYTSKAIEAYTKAYNLNNNSYLATFNIGALENNKLDKIQESYSANINKIKDINQDKIVEKDPKKKAAITDERTKKINEIKKANDLVNLKIIEQALVSANWFEKTFNIIKDMPTKTNKEKLIINKSVDNLSFLYEILRDKVRGKDVKLYDIYDAKVKQYDELHNKF